MFKKILSLALLVSTQTFAGGIILYEVGTPDIGLASAGWAARAEDAGTVFTNPAGMTRFCKPEFLVGVQPLYINARFDPNDETTVRGSDGDASTWLPAGGGYFVMPVNNRFSVGAAALGYFGSSLDYGHHWVGRYYVTRTECMGFSYVTGGAYRVSNCFSIGACANIMFAFNRMHAQIRNSLDEECDGRIRATGTHWALGAIVGALYEIDPCTRVGITYISEVKQRFKMTPKFLNIGPRLTDILALNGVLDSQIKINCNVPNWVMLSGYRMLNSRIAVMGNVGWQQWSRFSRAEISLGDPGDLTVTVTPKYRDTWHAALGMEYFWNCAKATFGVAYDSSMISDRHRTPSLPIGDQWRIGAGYEFTYKRIKLCTAYEFSWTGDLKMFQDRGPLTGTISGKFKNVYAQFISLSLTWDL